MYRRMKLSDPRGPLHWRETGVTRRAGFIAMPCILRRIRIRVSVAPYLTFGSINH